LCRRARAIREGARALSGVPSRESKPRDSLRLVSARLRVRAAALRGVPSAGARRCASRDLGRRPQGSLSEEHAHAGETRFDCHDARNGGRRAGPGSAPRGAAGPAAAAPPQAGASPTDPKSMSGMSILGNQDAPKSLVIVPWKSSEIGNGIGVSRALDTRIRAVDKDVFMRELKYYGIRSGTDK